MDACEYCRTEFGPSSPERECRVCGAPRQSWEFYEPESSLVRVSSDGPCGDVLLNARATVWPGGVQTIALTPSEVVVVDAASVDDPSCLLRLVDVVVGVEVFSGQGAPASSTICRKTFEKWMSGRVLYPWSPVRVTLSNPTSCPIDASASVSAHGCGVDFLSGKKKASQLPPPEPKWEKGGGP